MNGLNWNWDGADTAALIICAIVAYFGYGGLCAYLYSKRGGQTAGFGAAGGAASMFFFILGVPSTGWFAGLLSLPLGFDLMPPSLLGYGAVIGAGAAGLGGGYLILSKLVNGVVRPNKDSA